MNHRPLLVLIRHGQSAWNKENRFTGLIDVPLSPEGIEECKRVAHIIRTYRFGIAFTSELKRAYESLTIILSELGVMLSTVRHRALNERCYGDLQGLNKDAARKHYGEEQFTLWRRSFKTRPPGGESLEDTYNRVIPFFTSQIIPELKRGTNVLIVAHGNSLRALVAYIERVHENDIPQIEIENATPITYTLLPNSIFEKQV